MFLLRLLVKMEEEADYQRDRLSPTSSLKTTAESPDASSRRDESCSSCSSKLVNPVRDNFGYELLETYTCTNCLSRC